MHKGFRVPLVLSVLIAVMPSTAAAAGETTATGPVVDAAGINGTAAGAPAADPGEPARNTAKAPGDPLQPTTTRLRLKGLRGGRVTAGNRIKLAGTVHRFRVGQTVTIALHRGKRTVKRETVKVRDKGKHSDLGQFHWSRRMIAPGMYRIEAILHKGATWAGSQAHSRGFRLRYPSLRKGNRSDAVAALNDLLDARGYVPGKGSRFSAATGRAVLAFRKVNGMARKEKATGRIFKRLAKGKGGFKLKHPGADKHVEADLSRQVMVLASHGKAEEIYPISSGAPATPTITGKFRFYRKDAGYNSLGMYYSVYFIRGYATHGYHSVPTYPASHGCLRNPIPDSVHIYNWIDLGDPIYVYR